MDSTIKNAIIENLVIVKKLINDELYSKNKSRINDVLVTEMIMMSGYMSRFLEEKRIISKNEHEQIKEMISRIEEIRKETSRI